MLVVIGIIICGKGAFWIATAAMIYAAISMALLWAIPVADAEEEARKYAEWLVQIENQRLTFRPVEDRLDELERLKRRDMVAPEEYAAKRQEILKDL